MTEMGPLRRRMIEDHDGPQPVGGNPAILRARCRQIRPFLRSFAGAAWSGGSSRLPGSSGGWLHIVAGLEPGQTVCALRFLYGVTLMQAELPERIPYARTPRRLPVVLRAEEVVRFLEGMPSLKARAALTTAYAAGLRTSEAAGIKVGDINSSRIVIRVGPGKRRARPLCHAFTVTAGHSALPLAAGAAGILAVPGVLRRSGQNRGTVPTIAHPPRVSVSDNAPWEGA